MAKKPTMSMAARVKQKAKEAEFSGGNDTLRMKDGIGFFKPKKGKNELIIVPFTMGPGKNLEEIKEGELWFRQQILKHFRVGPDDKAVICPRTIGKKCPICEHRASLISQGRPTDDPEVKDLSPKKRELYYVIDLADDDKLKIFEYSYHNFGKKLEEEIREADDDSLAVNFADLDDGAIVIVRMGEASMGKNKFLEATRVDFEERSKAEARLVADAAEQVVPFSDLMVIPGYEELRNLFYDLDPELDGKDPEEEEEAPAPRRRTPAKEEDDGEEAPRSRGRGRARSEDEEEAPRSRGSSRRRTSSAEEEEEEAPAPRSRGRRPQEEDEEDPAPAPRRRNGGSKKDPEEEEAPAPRRRTPAKEEPSEPECAGDGTFGKDCDKLDACEDCPFWSDCRDLTDEYEAKQRKK